jgi:hypothetical protein
MTRLTSSQTDLLQALRDESASPDCFIELQKNELRTAQALARKGLIELRGREARLIETPVTKLKRLVSAIEAIDPPPTKIDREYPLVLKASEWKTLLGLIRG